MRARRHCVWAIGLRLLAASCLNVQEGGIGCVGHALYLAIFDCLGLWAVQVSHSVGCRALLWLAPFHFRKSICSVVLLFFVSFFLESGLYYNFVLVWYDVSNEAAVECFSL